MALISPTRPSQRCRSSWGSTPANIRLIPTTMETEFALFPALLRETVVADVEARLVPLFVCATVGTTSMTAVDPLKPVADVAGEIPMWLHVEAGSACICPEFRHYLDGVERADSLSLSPHKWLISYLVLLPVGPEIMLAGQGLEG
ncbi:hypothetical protein CDL15_Pgr023320 [Punica granatum]|uniref:Uncharacterized protein n=1 Tax=Punica granatum TaxID=22663 RepID=A0A218Y0Z2_PUNGR|nr:hypothetical protein CDL15_Pgr023320 [Punica granatum]